uniref:Uroporphyrinogen-III synthase n=1 Tax=Schistosoma haematobium TaxID=6185 RepID=A0A095AYU2_SCHHA
MYVVLLKSAGDNATSIGDDPYVQILKNSGFSVDLLETLDFEYNISNLAEYKNWRNNHSCIIFSSPRSVIACVKAGLTAKKAGFSPKGADSGDAEKLASFILKHFTSRKKVNTVVAYSSVENTQLHEKLRLNLCEGNPIPECLVFFSPSGVSLTEKILLTEIKPHRPNIKLVAMGRATATQLKELGLTVSAVASSPKPESLLTALKQLK